jgi:hypothetical protein
VPRSIPPGLTREHPFGASTGYELLYEGKRYAPKAAVGLACLHHLGRLLLPDQFSGGEAPGQANFVLRKLGFTVVKKGEAAPAQEGAAGKDWSGSEVRLAVADYFDMLEQELLGKPSSKTEHRKALEQLPADLRPRARDGLRLLRGFHRLAHGRTTTAPPGDAPPAPPGTPRYRFE